ncbi:hypothetical protein CSW25_11895 [Thermus scotoductus]|uniref:PatA-like N-terminal domain-containing protein n=1 Tax=Thermus scotoductus TaxID=37636 RepID=A0A430SDA8_THESC|nr:DUF4388 domain-containing protein [Thermus scotoductus]RTG98408.1 hypothetical protein CSW48_00140 [Thermus scotoductus]RTH07774.1 hypothetical protein CSW46_09260 [Thermus scotoductus]RTH10386.1 hypothetical protein CSW43_09055 [Thermus scotoductus]RTH13617.1 hypothetical protein CSW44_01445 [Thermus scotoductus]RTH16713.1 hypothetical protein CSW39_08640 [Thermus scotoductus]
MALFGSLNALPLEKLLQLLAHKEGAVEIWNVKDIPATTLYLKPGYIRSIDQHGKPLEALAAKATLQALLQAREGSFEFLPGAKPKHKVRLNWPVEKVLLSTVTLQDELERYRPYFPHPKAIFKASEVAKKHLPEESFLAKSLPYLEKGVSAEGLSKALSLPLDLVRFHLFRLERKGLVQRTGQMESSRPGLLELRVLRPGPTIS